MQLVSRRRLLPPLANSNTCSWKDERAGRLLGESALGASRPAYTADEAYAQVSRNREELGHGNLGEQAFGCQTTH
jgi:hypothetical protein